jgi:hypothetical protein
MKDTLSSGKGGEVKCSLQKTQTHSMVTPIYST